VSSAALHVASVTSAGCFARHDATFAFHAAHSSGVPAEPGAQKSWMSAVQLAGAGPAPPCVELAGVIVGAGGAEGDGLTTSLGRGEGEGDRALEVGALDADGPGLGAGAGSIDAPEGATSGSGLAEDDDADGRGVEVSTALGARSVG
jgi:hypothetical protein